MKKFHSALTLLAVSSQSWIEQGRWLLVAIGGASLLLETWMIVEAIAAWKRFSSEDSGIDHVDP